MRCFGRERETSSKSEKDRVKNPVRFHPTFLPSYRVGLCPRIVLARTAHRMNCKLAAAPYCSSDFKLVCIGVDQSAFYRCLLAAPPTYHTLQRQFGLRHLLGISMSLSFSCRARIRYGSRAYVPPRGVPVVDQDVSRSKLAKCEPQATSSQQCAAQWPLLPDALLSSREQETVPSLFLFFSLHQGEETVSAKTHQEHLMVAGCSWSPPNTQAA